MPAGSVKLTEIRSKIVFQEDPALARFRGFNAALSGVQAQHGRRHVQPRGGLVQVERAHGLVLVMVGNPHVVAPRLGPDLAVQVGLQALAGRGIRAVVEGL